MHNIIKALERRKTHQIIYGERGYMKSLSTFWAICILAITLGCASTTPVQHEVYFDYDVNFDFTKPKTYDWRVYPATLQISRFDRIRVEDAVNTHLAAKGLRLKPNNPDIYVVMFEGTVKDFDTTVLKVDYEVYEVGRLKLAFFDAKSLHEIWWGETRADLFYDLTAEEKDKIVSVAVKRILDYYPPKN